MIDVETDTLVEEVIDFKYRHPEMTKIRLAKEFGVQLAIIKRILSSIKWDHTPTEKCKRCGNVVIMPCIKCRDEINERVICGLRNI